MIPEARHVAYRLALTGLLLWGVAGMAYSVLRLTFGDRPVYIHVRWAPTVGDSARQRFEQRYGLALADPKERRTFGYALTDRSRENVRGLVLDPAVEDTHQIHRTKFRVGYFSPRLAYVTSHPWMPVGLEVLTFLCFLGGLASVGLALLGIAAPTRVQGRVLAVRNALLDPPGALRRTNKLQRESAGWISIVAIMNVLYVYGAFTTSTDLFGIDELRSLSASTYVICVVLGAAAAYLLGGVAARVRVDHPAIAPAIALTSAPIFFLLRSNVLNPDGALFTRKFEVDVPLIGAHLTHDEMLELFVHSRFWYYTHQWWNWTVVLSYQVLSCAAGVVFVYALIRMARRISPLPLIFIAGALSGGYMQLFFGDVENYTITAVLVVFYLLAAYRFVGGELDVWAPAGSLAVAMCFHLEAGFLGPSLLYLFWISYRRTGSARAIIRGCALATAILAATGIYLHFHGLPLDRVLSAHAGRAVQGLDMFAVGERLSYWVDQLNLLLLLCPAVLMVIPLLVHRSTRLDETGRFLAVAAGCMIVFQGLWRAQLGVYNDWNLYAIPGLVISVFLWRTLSFEASTRASRVAALGLAASGWLHTYAWIVVNHAGGR